MDYKEETKKAYDMYSDIFENKFDEYMNYIKEELDKFFNSLPANPKILDAGSGPGNHSLYLKNKGAEMFCIDISKVMVKRCIAKGLKAEVMDFEHLHLAENSFDGILVYTSLLHIPKNKFLDILLKISKCMKPAGILFLGMKKGEGEGFVVRDDRYLGTKRWFSLFSDEELRKMINSHFSIELFSETTVERKIFFNYFLRKK